MTPSSSTSGNTQYPCIIRRIAPYGMHVNVTALDAEGLLRIPELTNPAMLQDQTCVGTEIFARVIDEQADGTLILTQH